MEFKDLNSVLIIGMGGGLAKIVAGLLIKKHPHLKVFGIDPRPMDHFIKNKNMTYHRMKYTRSNFEKLFRNNKFDAVIHLGRMSHANANPRARLAQRLDLNVMGTNRILELSLQFDVKKVIILSTWHVYGAYSDNSVFIKEDSLLRAAIKYPELRDVVEMDQLATNWMWKHQHEIETLVLRPSSIIGPQINNAMSLYLRSAYAPLAIDFNPMVQFIHEFDMANVIVKSITDIPTGTYNVATDECMSIREAKKHIGLPTIPVPVFLLEQTAKVINKTLWSVPNYLIDYLKHSCILSNSNIKQYLPNDFFRFTIKDSLELLKLE